MACGAMCGVRLQQATTGIATEVASRAVFFPVIAGQYQNIANNTQVGQLGTSGSSHR